MSKVISVNSGSSSLKFQLFDMPSETVLTSGQAERIGQDMGAFTIKVNGEKHTEQLPLPDHQRAVDVLLKALIDWKIVDSLEEIQGAGHRIVQGGPYFDQSVVVTPDVVEKVDELCELAPLHNHAHLVCYNAFVKALPHIRHVFVFDTAFHQTMGPESYLFPVPYDWYTQYKIRRYGAHGTSHWYVNRRAAELMGKDVNTLNMITCHLGNGASISAIRNGKCINTSMGLTPMGGVMMGTRSGDVDPGALEFLAKKEGLDITGLLNMLNKKSGVHGLSGISSDFRDLAAGAAAGNKQAQIAIEVFTYRVAKYVGSYVAAMNGVDAITFTAGIGENDGSIREKVCSYLGYLGITIDKEANSKRGEEIVISTADSKVKVLVIPTNEELAIARETVALV